VAEAQIIARRRKWTAEQKAALLAEVEVEGGRISVLMLPPSSGLKNGECLVNSNDPNQRDGDDV
jgi:hypothetical protein